MTELTLREVCETYQVSRRAVQGYEKAGLVSATRKNKYGYLLYDEESQIKISKIKQYQDMGFQIKEIKELLGAPKEQLKSALLQRNDALEQELQHTGTMLELIQKLISEL